MPSFRLALALLATRAARAADDVSFDVVLSGNASYFNRGGSVSIVGGSFGGLPVVCYEDYGNPSAGSLTCRRLESVSSADASEGASVVVSSQDNPSTSFAELDSTAGVVCYAPFGRNDGRPTCNVISLGASDIQAGPDVVVDEGLSSTEQSTYVEATTVAGLSSSAAVVCYRSKDSTAKLGVLRCAALTRTGSELEVSSTLKVNAAFTKAASVVGFSESMAMVCYSDNLDDTSGPAEDFRGFCSMLNISADALTVPGGNYMPIQLWEPVDTTFAQGVVAQRLAADTALVCFSEGSGSSGVVGGYCIYVEVTASTVTKLAELSIAAGELSHMALERFSDETAVLCYLTDTQGVCVEMYASGKGGAAQLTKGNPLLVDPGDAKAGHALAITSVSEEDGVLCYTETGEGNDLNWGKCVPVEATPTSTSTGTYTSSTPHTTSATSSTSATATSETSTTATSSTTPHTTTATSSTTETLTATSETTATVTGTTATQTTAEQVVDSGAVRITGSCAPLVAFLVAQLWS